MENKSEKYKELISELQPLIEEEDNIIGVLANVCALIKEKMNFLWVGFYLVGHNSIGKKELLLGPFQGSVACYRIAYGRGVCGTAWMEKKTIVVDDVEKFDGHIACSSLSRSEIVVPIFRKDSVAFGNSRSEGIDAEDDIVGVLDIDSDQLSTFDSEDKLYLEEAMNILAQAIF